MKKLLNLKHEMSGILQQREREHDVYEWMTC